MEIITQKDLIKNVYIEWAEQYDLRSKDTPESFKKIGKKLKELDLNKASAEEVNKIIGNNTWTTVSCDECSRNVDHAIYFDKADMIICVECLSEAITKLANQQIKI